MPSLLPIILTASHFVLAADQVPKFNNCRPAAAVVPARARRGGVRSYLKIGERKSGSQCP